MASIEFAVNTEKWREFKTYLLKGDTLKIFLLILNISSIHLEKTVNQRPYRPSSFTPSLTVLTVHITKFSRLIMTIKGWLSVKERKGTKTNGRLNVVTAHFFHYRPNYFGLLIPSVGTEPLVFLFWTISASCWGIWKKEWACVRYSVINKGATIITTPPHHLYCSLPFLNPEYKVQQGCIGPLFIKSIIYVWLDFETWIEST